MSDSDGEIIVAEEATAHHLMGDMETGTEPVAFHSSKSNESRRENGAPMGQSTGEAAVGSITHHSTTLASCEATVTDIGGMCSDSGLQEQERSNLHPAFPITTECTTSTNTSLSAASTTTLTTTTQSTSTPLNQQRFPNQLNNDTITYRQYYGRADEEEDDWEEGGEGGMGNVAGSILGYSPLVYDVTEEGDGTDLEELYVPISGYEVMEQRAKFTVFKLNVQKSVGEGYFIFRRYTDFTRLNNKLKLLFPGFRLALPPKRWFGNNFDPIFLEDRLLGLQAFLNNITGHKDVRKSGPVREFLCLSDPPGPHDSLEESRVMVDSLEEIVYNLKRDVAERDRLLRKKDAEIAALKGRLQELENSSLPLETERVGTDQESESSTVEGDRRSCVEADLMDHGIQDANNEGVSEITMETTSKVNKETLDEETVKCSGMVSQNTVVAMATSQPATPVGADSR